VKYLAPIYLLSCGAFWCAGQPSPAPPPPVVTGNLPAAVQIPSGVTSPEQTRPFFDYFSWESFIALDWPTIGHGVPNQPTNPNIFLQSSNGAATVWTSYKSSFALFGQRDQRPPAWGSDVLPVSPCGTAKPDATTLVMAAKGGELLNAPPNEAFSVPLIDQNNNYIYFGILFNQDQYNFIRGADSTPAAWYYLVKNLAAAEPVTMPSRTLKYPASGSVQGAIMLKAAWRLMTAKDKECTGKVPGPGCRYYVIPAQVYDPGRRTCTVQPMGLVGFHLVQKLQNFPEWIWSTFEQVDNVQLGAGAPAGTPISLNNGTNKPPTIGGWANRPSKPVPPLQPPNQRSPVQVTRFNPIAPSTAGLNQTFQTALKATVWRYYQLVATQWPTQAKSFKLIEKAGVYPKDCGAAFPVNGVTNTAAETYFQSPSDAAGAGGNSCMSCHYRADLADFSWSLKRGAH